VGLPQLRGHHDFDGEGHDAQNGRRLADDLLPPRDLAKAALAVIV